jgi:hypothetical protein
MGKPIKTIDSVCGELGELNPETETQSYKLVMAYFVKPGRVHNATVETSISPVVNSLHAAGPGKTNHSVGKARVGAMEFGGDALYGHDAGANRAERLSRDQSSSGHPMPVNPEIPKLDHRGRRSGPGAPGLLTKVLAVVVGAALLVGAVAVSFVLFAVALAGILIFGIYVWWKTRHLRKELSRELSARSQGGTVIEGEVIEGEVIRDVPPRKTSNFDTTPR